MIDKNPQELRRANLQKIIDLKFSGTQAALVEFADMNQGEVSGLLNGRRAFGERKARAIEEKLGLHFGALDRPVNENEDPLKRALQESLVFLGYQVQECSDPEDAFDLMGQNYLPAFKINVAGVWLFIDIRESALLLDNLFVQIDQFTSNLLIVSEQELPSLSQLLQRKAKQATLFNEQMQVSKDIGVNIVDALRLLGPKSNIANCLLKRPFPDQLMIAQILVSLSELEFDDLENIAEAANAFKKLRRIRKRGQLG